MDLYLEPFRKYVVFSGRARRAEYWVFGLVNIVISLVLSGVDMATGTLDLETGIGAFSGIFSLVILLPSIAVTVRRLHDTGRSAWWLLLVFIPLIGVLVMLVFMLLGSEDGDNQYGAKPVAAN
jgi:uncharacterized membrane protein YhaH (DUF805 family)